MASSYSISTGSGEIQIEGVNPSLTYVGVQVVQSSLDADITLKLKQSEDGAEYHDLPEGTIKMKTTTNSILMQSESFELSLLYLDIDVGSATTGTLELYAVSR